MTVLPAASAAATWPVKIASGKFHGLMQTNTPRPRSASSLRSPVGPGQRQRRARNRVARAPRSSAGNPRPRALRRGVGQRLAGFAHAARHERRRVLLEQRRRRARSTRGARSPPASRPSLPGARTPRRCARRPSPHPRRLTRADRARRCRPDCDTAALVPLRVCRRRSGAALQGCCDGALAVAAASASDRLAVGEIEAARVRALAARTDSRGSGMRGCATRSSASHLRDRIGDDLFGRRLASTMPIDERGVGAVLEQAPHQIGQQVLVAPTGA